jgi:hypothetical protein
MFFRLKYTVVLSIFLIMFMCGHGAIAQMVPGAPMIPGTDVQFLPGVQMTPKRIAVYGDLVNVEYRIIPVPSCYGDTVILQGTYKGVAIYKIRMISEKRLVYSTFVPPCGSGKF